MISRPSPNFDERPSGVVVDMLVIHYTGMETAEAAIARLCDPTAKVSAHYCVDEDGAVSQLVAEESRAWHAGVAHWRGATDINARSIGIELVNPGHEFGYRKFPEPQIAALENLCLDILSRHRIPSVNVVGHSDVAPRRKQDPGELFPWRRLAAAGIGLWPDAATVGESDDLARFGYETEDRSATIMAFQRRFRPNRIDGVWDDDCASRLAGLLNLA